MPSKRLLRILIIADFILVALSVVGAQVGESSLPEPSWNPAREFKFDVTRQLRAIVNGDAKFHGFALRVVPDRSVDDGWTVRVQFPSQPKVYLEIDSYTDAPATQSGK